MLCQQCLPRKEKATNNLVTGDKQSRNAPIIGTNFGKEFFLSTDEASPSKYFFGPLVQ